jgi:AraC-like DNA-binding protein
MSHGVTLERAETSLGPIELFTFEQHRHAFPRHVHDVLTLGVFGPGNGTIRVRSSTQRAAVGMLLAIAPNEVHSAEPSRGSGWTYRSICPSPTLLAHALDGAAPAFSFGRPVIDDPALAREVGTLHATLAGRSDILALEVRVVALLRRAVRCHGSAWLPEPDRVASVREIAARAGELMEARLAGPVHLAEVARECGVSPFQLIRAFHAEFGVPPHAWLMQARLRRARAMLRAGELISSAAFASGFVDQSHLTRVFRRSTGMTPGAYMKGQAPKRRTR